MNKEKKNQYIVIGMIGVLLIVVVSFVTISIFKHKEEPDTISIKFQQIYSSDYKLRILSDKYFIGSYQDNRISIIIDDTGKEIYNGLEDILYDGIYVLKDGNYLIYSNRNNTLKTYVFDGKNISSFYQMEDIGEVKPLIYTDNKQEYIIGFVSEKEEGTSILPLDNTGFIVLTGKQIIGDRQEDGVYITYNENYFVAKDSEGLMGIVDKKGDTIVDFKYLNIVNTFNNSFIAQNTKGKYGIIDKNGDILVKFNYKVIDGYNDYYLVVNSQNKMALYDKEYNGLTGFVMDYDDILTYDFRNRTNSIKLYVVGNHVLVANNMQENLNGTEYNKHSLYVINDGNIVKTIKEYGFGCSDVIYTLDKDMIIQIYDKSMEQAVSIELEDLRKVMDINLVSDEIIEVNYLSVEEEMKVKYFDLNGEEVINELGELVLKNAVYHLYMKGDGTKVLNLYNADLDKMGEISGEYIEVEKEYIVVDNSIYKIVVS